MATCTVQHVNKVSSDQLLRKFAELESEPNCESPKKTGFGGRRRRKRSRISSDRDNNERPIVRNGSLIDRKSLLSPENQRSALLRQLGIGKSGIRAREIIINGLFLAKIEKTWRKTVEGASKMFMEKHRNHHILLRNEIV
ncbi:uncharacterized protein LOC143886296 [Tasmannia lanceolata]|uniref:uncharacterized protein LOC143886296 n=1 Tax=Tasmannia lanceolata TaxID=3420 RepID=UPI004062E116